MHVPGDAVEERRLPRAVGPDQADELAFLQLKGEIVVGEETPEPLRGLIDLEGDHLVTSRGAQ